ncbi:MAG: M48 family metallopeptidase [Planctomycetota bacterium]
MDFFASQDLARRNSRRLIFYFIAAVVSMIAGIYFVVMLATGAAGMNEPVYNEFGQATGTTGFHFFEPTILAAVASAVSLIVGSGSLYKVSALSGGGESVASMMGGRHIPPNSTEPGDRRILNVVEEMALAAGTPVPPVYVIENEPGINAFAAGYTVDDAVIGVTRGTVNLLSRDELQGVVAHEFSHILNGDMRMSIRMIGVLHGIQLLALIGYYVLRGVGRSRDKKGGAAAIVLIAIGVIIIGSIGMFFARLIKAMVSRQREYLADASAVQFTRNPEGIAGALKMIGANMEGSVMQNARSEEISHMTFSSMFKSNFFNMFATHPPLEKRIAELDPHFDGDYQAFANARLQRLQRRDEARRKQEEKKQQIRMGIPGMGGGRLGSMMGEQFPVDPAILIAGIGLPDEDDVEYSHALVDRIPEVVADASRDVFSARCVVFASLLNEEREIRRAQLHAVAKGEGQATIDETIRLMNDVDNLEARFRLPVFEILQGTLTGMSPEQYDTFRESVDRLVHADNRVDLFEFFMRHHLIVHLDRRFGRVSPPQVTYKTIDPLQNEVCSLIAILVGIGHEDIEEARGAFAAAIQSLEMPWQDQVHLIDRGYDYPSLAIALERLNEAAPPVKKKLLTSMAVAIMYDQIVTVEEAELFRAIAESLDCPVPPVVATINRDDADPSGVQV